MTISDLAGTPASDVAATMPRTHTHTRTPRHRRYAMTAPTFFTVEYAINPWMDTSVPVDTHLALSQWEVLRQTAYPPQKRMVGNDKPGPPGGECNRAG